MKTRTREYIRPIPVSYWFSRPAYVLFLIRELSSVALAGYAIFLLVMLARARDAVAFQALLDGLKSPVSILLHLIALGFALYHTLTFFNITPRVLVFYRDEDRVADSVIIGIHYAIWAVISVVILLIVLRG